MDEQLYNGLVQYLENLTYLDGLNEQRKNWI